MTMSLRITKPSNGAGANALRPFKASLCKAKHMSIKVGFWLLIAIFYCSNAIAKDEGAMIPEDFIKRYAEAISTK